jgi:hypothetical protein
VRTVSLIVVTLFFSSAALAAGIREFDIKTIERLGNELTQVSQTHDRGASTPAKKRARKIAIAALKGRLFDIRYDYVVLDDPDGSGFLVYALGKGRHPTDTVIDGHFRVTVSADGGKAESVDALSHTLFIDEENSPRVGTYRKSALSKSQAVGTRPVETLVYASNHMKIPIAVATPPKGQVWFIENGKIRKLDR